jgi:hypothetical protein
VANERLEDEIQKQVRRNQLVLEQLSKEDKHLSGEENGGIEYNTLKMFDQILERNYDRWRRELAAIDDIDEQDRYYRGVIFLISTILRTGLKCDKRNIGTEVHSTEIFLMTMNTLSMIKTA